jgi:peptidoglycan/xylan/chitin deacetylase (PgdA/CDA1 family)
MIVRLLKLFISIVFFVVHHTAVAIAGLFKKQIPGTLAVLTYHSVKSSKLHKFKRQMDYLLKAGQPVLADIAGPLINKQHYIAVTFDDGFQSILINALPAMYKRKIPATIFVTTGSLGKQPNWLCDSNHQDVDEVLVTPKQLKTLPDDIVTIGSHCVTHPNLTNIDENDAMRELIESKRTLEKILKKSVDLLSFPHGSYNKKIIELSHNAGYKRVFSNLPDLPIFKIQNYLFGRISVSLQDWHIEYRLKFLGAYQWLPYAVKLKKTLLSARRFHQVKSENMF